MYFLENISTIALLFLEVVRVTERRETTGNDREERKERRWIIEPAFRTSEPRSVLQQTARKRMLRISFELREYYRVKKDVRSVSEQRGNLMKHKSYELLVLENETHDSELSLQAGNISQIYWVSERVMSVFHHTKEASFWWSIRYSLQ